MIFGVRGAIQESKERPGPPSRIGAMIVFYDTETKSCWWEGNGACMGGERDGEKLAEIPSEKDIPFSEWRAKHPDTLVFSHEGMEE